MKYFLSASLLLFLWIIMVNCVPQKKITDPNNSNTQEMKDYKSIAQKHLNVALIDYIFNENQTRVIGRASIPDDPMNPSYPLDMILIDVYTGEVLYSKKLPKGDVKWLENDQIKVSVMNNIGAALEEYYIFDCKEKKEIYHGPATKDFHKKNDER